MSCGKQFEQFHSAGHPDDGKRFACGIMVENMNAGITAFACGYKTPARESPIKECAVCAACEVLPICDAHITGGSWHHRQGVSPCKPKIAEIVVGS